MGQLNRHIIRAGATASTLLLAGALVLIPQGRASAEEIADSVVVAGTVDPQGTLTLTSTITFPAEGAPDQLVQRIDTTTDAMNYTFYRYELSAITATAGGRDLAPTISTDGDYTVITIDTSAVAEPVEIGYTVRGAATSNPQAAGQAARTTVSWRVLQGLSVAVRQVSGQIVVPGTISSVDCVAGAPTAPLPCTLWAGGTHDSPYPSFENDALGAGQVVALTFQTPASVIAPNEIIEEHWTLDRAFSTRPVPLFWALGVLLVGALGLWTLLRLRGSDRIAREPLLPASFLPVGPGESAFTVREGIRPGHVGTVMDERVDPVDISATILDLAVRGHLRIVELPETNLHAPLDWTFERLSGSDELSPFERTLLDAIAPAGAPATRVSEISRPVTEVIPTVQSQLYDEVVARGWFSHRPDAVRRSWQVVGWLGVAAGLTALVVLVLRTEFGLLGLVLVALGLGLLVVAQQMPRRTAQGSALQAGLAVLAMELHTQPTDQVPRASAYAQISAVLPYAVVLGGRERWLQAVVAADDDPGVPDGDDLSWYHAPGDWQLADLPGALNGFLISVQGQLYARD